jgi:hypothetical protein
MLAFCGSEGVCFLRMSGGLGGFRAGICLCVLDVDLSCTLKTEDKLRRVRASRKQKQQSEEHPTQGGAQCLRMLTIALMGQGFPTKIFSWLFVEAFY